MLVAVPVAGKKKAEDICRDFIQGAPKAAGGYVFYGVNHSNAEVWRRVKASGSDWYYIDNSYFDAVRGLQYRVTKNGLQFRGPMQTSNGARFNAMSTPILPWQKNGNHILVLPQSTSFMEHVVEYPGDWLKTTVRSLKSRFPSHPVRVRPWSGDKHALVASLQDDLQDAWALATHSSAGAVEALRSGIAVFTSPHSPAFMTAARLLHYAESREQLLHNLADNQWTLNEMKEGVAWKALQGSKLVAGLTHPDVGGTGS